MTNMSIQPLWLTHFNEILLVLEFHSQNLLLACFLIRPILDPKFPLMDPLKVEAIVNLPPPRSIRQLQSLQGKPNL